MKLRYRGPRGPLLFVLILILVAGILDAFVAPDYCPGRHCGLGNISPETRKKIQDETIKQIRDCTFAMMNPITLALGATAITMLGISELIRRVRLNPAASAIAVAIFAALALFAIVMLWRVEQWGRPKDMPEGRVGTTNVGPDHRP